MIFYILKQNEFWSLNFFPGPSFTIGTIILTLWYYLCSPHYLKFSPLLYNQIFSNYKNNDKSRFIDFCKILLISPFPISSLEIHVQFCAITPVVQLSCSINHSPTTTIFFISIPITFHHLIRKCFYGTASAPNIDPFFSDPLYKQNTSDNGLHLEPLLSLSLSCPPVPTYRECLSPTFHIRSTG